MNSQAGLPPVLVISMKIVTKIVFKGYKLMRTISLKHQDRSDTKGYYLRNALKLPLNRVS